MLVKRFLFWLPRVLSALFAAFISLFALDVFGAGYGFWETIWALFVHLIPTWLILAALAISWRWECWAGFCFRSWACCTSSPSADSTGLCT